MNKHSIPFVTLGIVIWIPILFVFVSVLDIASKSTSQHPLIAASLLIGTILLLCISAMTVPAISRGLTNKLSKAIKLQYFKGIQVRTAVDLDPLALASKDLDKYVALLLSTQFRALDVAAYGTEALLHGKNYNKALNSIMVNTMDFALHYPATMVTDFISAEYWKFNDIPFSRETLTTNRSRDERVSMNSDQPEYSLLNALLLRGLPQWVC